MEVKAPKKVLCVVAHADDEILMCGGTLAKHIEAGDEVSIIVVTDNTLRHGRDSDENHMKEAGKVLGVNIYKVFNCYLGDQMLDSIPLTKIINSISVFIPEQPDIIYTHSLSDLNRDHRIVTEAILVMYRTVETDIEIYGGYVGSSTEHGMIPFKPDTYVNIYGWLMKKLNAFDCYKDEAQEEPQPRNRAGLTIQAQYFGNQVGLEYAEPFETLKRVIVE